LVVALYLRNSYSEELIALLRLEQKSTSWNSGKTLSKSPLSSHQNYTKEKILKITIFSA
jgi:hypothetical protein